MTKNPFENSDEPIESASGHEENKEQKPSIDLNQQVEMTSKWERLMTDPEEQKRFWSAFSAKYPDAARKFEEAAQEREDILRLQKAVLGKKSN